MGFALDFITATKEILDFSPVYWTCIISFVPMLIRLCYIVLFPKQ